MTQTQTTTDKTKKILFEYFANLKTLKFESRTDRTFTPESKSVFICDISRILNNIDFTHDEKEILIYFGQRLHTPKYTSRWSFFWDSAIAKIESAFIKNKII